MTKSYSESSSQTNEVDPHNHLKNYQSVSEEGESCSSLDHTTQHQHEINNNNNTQQRHGVNDDNTSEDDASSSSSSSTTSLDQEMELQKRLNPACSRDIKVLQNELLLW